MPRYVPEKLDVKRLLDVICKLEVNISPERGQGKTLGLFYLMLTEILHHDHNTNHVYIAPHNAYTSLRVVDFADFLQDHGVEFVKKETRIMIPETNQMFEFVSLERFIDPNFIRGRKLKKIFFDASIHHFTNQEWNGWADAMMYLQATHGRIIG